MTIHAVVATDSTGLAAVRTLLREYAAFLLATCDGIPAGSVSVRSIQLADGQMVGEMRRMWVRPKFRGNSLGKALAEAAIQIAQQMGHSALYLDTVAEKMPTALHLYRSVGFQECPRYNKNLVPGLIFLRKEF